MDGIGITRRSSTKKLSLRYWFCEANRSDQLPKEQAACSAGVKCSMLTCSSVDKAHSSQLSCRAEKHFIWGEHYHPRQEAGGRILLSEFFCCESKQAVVRALGVME